jgi:hypothetical protein
MGAGKRLTLQQLQVRPSSCTAGTQSHRRRQQTHQGMPCLVQHNNGVRWLLAGAIWLRAQGGGKQPRHLPNKCGAATL